MKKLVTLLLLIAGLSLGTFGQQIPMFSEFMLNDYVYNPAMGGKNPVPILNVGYRSQWIGFEGAPKTFYMSGNGTAFRNASNGDLHDIGGFVFAESSGIQINRGLSASYAYHKEIFPGHELSMGTFLGFREFSLDVRNLILPENQNDQAVNVNFQRFYTPDASIGTLYYTEDYYVGLSINQIFRGTFDYSNPDSTWNSENKLFGHTYFMAGYDFKLDEDWTLQPNLLVKGVKSARNQYDINVKMDYQERMFAGVTFRTYDAMSFTVGIDIPKVFEIGYAYDMGISKFRTTNLGTHEIILTFRFEDYRPRNEDEDEDDE